MRHADRAPRIHSTMRPPYMTSTRSQKLFETIVRLCVMKINPMPRSATEIVQDAQHLVLHRHIERRGGFIRDQEIGIGDQHHRDHRALAHPAGKLMRIELKNHFRISDAHLFQHLQRTLFRLASAGPAMKPIGLHDLRADALHGVQRVYSGSCITTWRGFGLAARAIPARRAQSDRALVESEFARLHSRPARGSGRGSRAPSIGCPSRTSPTIPSRSRPSAKPTSRTARTRPPRLG